MSQVAAVGARIADELVPLIERLRVAERLLRAETVEAIGMALQFGQVVEQRRLRVLRFGAQRLDGRFA